MKTKLIGVFVLCIGIVLLFSYLGTRQQKTEGFSSSGSLDHSSIVTAITGKFVHFPVNVTCVVKDYYGNMLCDVMDGSGNFQELWLTPGGKISPGSSPDPGLTPDNPGKKNGSYSGQFASLMGQTMKITIKADKSATIVITKPDGASETILVDAKGKTSVSGFSSASASSCKPDDYQCLYGNANWWGSSSGIPNFHDDSLWTEQDKELYTPPPFQIPTLALQNPTPDYGFRKTETRDNPYNIHPPRSTYGSNAYSGPNYAYQGVNAANGYENYNHYTGSAIPTMYYGPGGATAKFVEINGNYYLIIARPDGHSVFSTTTSAPSSTSSFVNKEGHKAELINTDRGKAVVLYGDNGSKTIFFIDNDQTKNPNLAAVNNYSDSGSSSSSSSRSASSSSSSGSSSASTSINNATTTKQATATAATGSNDSSCPHAIPADQSNMYMLKSAMVPMECPHCGSTSGLTSSSGDPLSGYSVNGSITSGSSSSSDKKGRHKCPPCPACSRCPEPSFECKKVPNYRRAGDLDDLPRPILNDFTTFGV